MSPQPVNGHSNHVEPVVDVDEDDTANDDNLSPPPESMSSGPANAAEDEIVVGASKNNGHRSSPARANSVDDDVEMGDSDANDKPLVTPYVHNKRKRLSTYNDVDDSINYDDDSVLATPNGDKAKGHGTTGTKGVPVGYWRESKAVDEIDKQMCVAFIDTRDRLRTRQIHVTLDGRPLPKEAIPVGPGGSWVTFDRIVFNDDLVGLEHNQIKEFVRIRIPQIEAGETTEQEAANKKAAIVEAKRRVAANPPQETPNGTQIAYGKDIPESAIPPRTESKRRKLVDTSSTPQPSADMTAVRAANMPAPLNSGSRYPLDPLPGTRPTKILLGYWAHSNEPDLADKHAVYGILGANDMFRVKVTRETRDGRSVIGNFPTGAGALWINYEEVVFEAHLTQLTRPEIKEYTRVRQRQLDDKERPEQRLVNETTAVFEAQRRVMCQQNGGEIRPPPPAILPTLANGASQDVADDPDFLINSVRPRPRHHATENNSNMGLPVNRPELRQRASRGFPAPPTATDPVNRGLVNSSMIENTFSGRRSTGGPVPVATEVRPITREPQLAPPMTQPYQPEVSERSAAMAQGGIDRMEQAHMRIRQRDASRDSTPRSSFMDDSQINNNNNNNNNINANHGHPSNPAGTRPAQLTMQRLQGVWVDQETNRVRATGSEDEQFHNGIKYERKQSGAFAGKLTSQGNLITIDGKDYVEYRILMVPSFN